MNKHNLIENVSNVFTNTIKQEITVNEIIDYKYIMFDDVNNDFKNNKTEKVILLNLSLKQNDIIVFEYNGVTLLEKLNQFLETSIKNKQMLEHSFNLTIKNQKFKLFTCIVNKDDEPNFIELYQSNKNINKLLDLTSKNFNIENDNEEYKLYFMDFGVPHSPLLFESNKKTPMTKQFFFDYMSHFHSTNYSMTRLSKHFKNRTDIFMKNDITLIPYYNNESGKEKHIEFFWKPDQKIFDKYYYDMFYQKHGLTDGFLETIYNLDLLDINKNNINKYLSYRGHYRNNKNPNFKSQKMLDALENEQKSINVDSTQQLS